MKLRSAQFVLLVLLFSSLGLSDRSSLSLADDLIGSGCGVLLSQQSIARNVPSARPLTHATASAAQQQLAPAHQRSLTHAWTMPHPAAQAVALQATSAIARA